MAKETKLKDLQLILDEVLNKMQDNKMDNNTALAFSKVIATKISGYKEQIKYKKITGSPDIINFFE